jgi:hypothetical protein
MCLVSNFFCPGASAIGSRAPAWCNVCALRCAEGRHAWNAFARFPSPQPSPASGKGGTSSVTSPALLSPLPLAGEVDARSAAGEGKRAEASLLEN